MQTLEILKCKIGLHKWIENDDQNLADELYILEKLDENGCPDKHLYDFCQNCGILRKETIKDEQLKFTK